MLNASDSILRGVAVEGFGIGVSVPLPSDSGDLIQGNFIGEYLHVPGRPRHRSASVGPRHRCFGRAGNTSKGLCWGWSNATVGGTETQDTNVICWQRIPRRIGRAGRIGVPGTRQTRLASPVHLPAEAISRPGTVRRRSDRIDRNRDQSVEHRLCFEQRDRRAPQRGPATSSRPTRVTVYTLSASERPGILSKPMKSAWLRAGVFFLVTLSREIWQTECGSTMRPTTRSADRVGSDGNVISSNQGRCLYHGWRRLRQYHSEQQHRPCRCRRRWPGNDQAGVADYVPGTLIGPGNVISANLIGVLVSGASATGVVIRDNLIGTDSSGIADLGNAKDGVEIDNATGVTVLGDSQGPQVISGNLIGVEIDGSTSTGNLVEGNLIGTDKSGTADRGNSEEGVLIEERSETRWAGRRRRP